jgi:soluble lytic murein transglycosylase
MTIIGRARAHRVAVAVAALAAACARKDGARAVEHPDAAVTVAASATPSASASIAPAAASASASTAAADPLDSLSARELLAAGSYARAAKAFDRLPTETAATPLVRLGRARAGVGVCTPAEGAAARTTIEALERDPSMATISGELAALHTDALVCEAIATAVLTDATPAALRSRRDAVSQRALAKFLRASGDLAGARAAIDRAIADAPRAGLSVGALRRERLAIDRALGDAAAISDDVLRLWREHPAAFDATHEPAPSDPSAHDALARADAAAQLGRADWALEAIELASRKGAAARDVARAKGRALYRAKSYGKAIAALSDAAKGFDDREADDDRFHAARARSRSGDDDGAIKDYEALAERHGDRNWGAEARYLAAQLRFLHGRWTEAIDAYQRYLASPSARVGGQGTNVREAKRSRALALLASGRAQDARRAFEALADAERDDGGVRARLHLLATIAREKTGDLAGARGEYAATAAARPFDWVGQAARARLVALGDVPAPWPSMAGGREPAPTLAPPIDLLVHAGLSLEAQARMASEPSLWPKEPLERCAVAAAIDDGASSYRFGLGLRSDSALDPAAMRCANPEPWSSFVAALERRERLPPGLLYALIRQESAFRQAVVSPAGAIGLAQLMPETAAATAAHAGLRFEADDVRALYAPDLQLELAATHVGELLAALGGNDEAKRTEAIPLVIAAYNAGLPAVRRWLGEAGALDADVFLERIPFLETRAYVVHVLGNLARYAVLAGRAPPPIARSFSAFAPPPVSAPNP